MGSVLQRLWSSMLPADVVLPCEMDQCEQIILLHLSPKPYMIMLADPTDITQYS